VSADGLSGLSGGEREERDWRETRDSDLVYLVDRTGKPIRRTNETSPPVSRASLRFRDEPHE